MVPSHVEQLVVEPVRSSGSGRIWRWAASLALIAGIGGVAGYRYKGVDVFANSSRVAAQQPAIVELAAERENEMLVLRWNPEDPPLRNASDAGLVIRDGDQETRFTLDRAQIQGGAISYTPKNNDVTFSMETHVRAGPAGRGILLVIDPFR